MMSNVRLCGPRHFSWWIISSFPPSNFNSKGTLRFLNLEVRYLLSQPLFSEVKLLGRLQWKSLTVVLHKYQLCGLLTAEDSMTTAPLNSEQLGLLTLDFDKTGLANILLWSMKMLHHSWELYEVSGCWEGRDI